MKKLEKALSLLKQSINLFDLLPLQKSSQLSILLYALFAGEGHNAITPDIHSDAG
ncbi:hypothetical protein [Pseudomonas capsici]|uniref:hypothetical protein n=1 Tax=Pseudomonas capsici TaxID=2810614 RepID=UPI0013C2B604|nr:MULTISPECIES: hypothetical protein [Pseudomonas]MBX8608941.1 hypothetical protein [Pseudomonas cichorii]MCV4289487.1 hypothetical protein [Pseudomonas capsici]MCV4342991.1 hypothetical protein [Pseudomonas capsici]